MAKGKRINRHKLAVTQAYCINANYNNASNSNGVRPDFDSAIE